MLFLAKQTGSARSDSILDLGFFPDFSPRNSHIIGSLLVPLFFFVMFLRFLSALICLLFLSFGFLSFGFCCIFHGVKEYRWCIS